MLASENNPREDNSETCEALLASKKALFVGAHPDDIEFRAGGLVYLMRTRGVEVIFAIATRGGKGWIWPFRGLLEGLRERYQRRAARILGVGEVLFLGYADGKLTDSIQALTDDLRSLLDARQPDVVLCWDPDHNSNPHPDHQAAAEAAREASFDKLRMLTCWYGTLQPNLWVGFDEETMRAKVRALKAHRTETPWFYFDARLKKRLIAAMRAQGSKVGCDYAETFRLTQPHPPTQP